VLHETRDQTAMFRPVTKAARMVSSAEEIAGAIASCAATALTAQTGPVYLGIPTDLLSAPAPDPPASVSEEPAPAPAPPAGLTRASALLAAASRPLIWAGGGALRAGAGELVGELAIKLAAPVLTTYMGRGLLPADHPCAVPGPVHAREIGALWDEADLVLAVGTDFDGMMTQNWLLPAPPKLVSVNVDEADANKSYVADVTLVGDARAVLEQLAPLVPSRDGLDALRRRLHAIAGQVAAAVRADDEQASVFLEIMDRALPQDAVVVADMCIQGYWLAGYRRVPLPRKLAFPMGWGTLGFAFPASLGAALANSGPAVCVIGDGGFMYACGELATVVQEQVPLTIVLVDDRAYGMLRFDQRRAAHEPFGVDLVGPGFVALARSFGVPACAVEGFGRAFEDELRRCVADGRRHMIVVRATLKPPPTTSPRWYRRT
jgi:acetolactate synthase-1/2/3 large subunit